MGRFTDPMSKQILSRQRLAVSCLWRPKPENKFFEDKLGRYYFDKDLVEEVIKVKKIVSLLSSLRKVVE